jgi:hypothetical protein
MKKNLIANNLKMLIGNKNEFRMEKMNNRSPF